ncbi:MAG: molybdate ABC transporter substrate-binding protein [Prolixibacteraceae bacterium]|jgi:molybdate transport system substrate-binding protein|nr:molybdate ABC transporter substrate-binding protein [Prolixibacteraceae bacterium]
MLKIKLYILLSVVLLIQQNVFSKSMTIATASNFREPMTDIIKQFEIENPDIEIKSVFGSSGNLYNQITNSAPFDIYFSANVKYPQKIYEGGFSYDLPKIYAIGQLVLWSKRVDVSQGLSILEKEKVKRIAIANPDLAPYGISAMESMKYFNLYIKLKPKLVIAENIAQSAQFAVTGNADVAFIAKSQLNMNAIKGKGTSFNIPFESYSSIEQAFVVLKREGNESITQKFVAFLSKPEIQQMIVDYGYKLEENE